MTLSDGKKEQHLDVMGRGSIIGISNILYGEKWAYYATAMSERGTIVFRLKNDVLKLMAKVYNPLQLALEKASGYLTNEKPMTQIDYLISNEYFDTDEKSYQNEFENY